MIHSFPTIYITGDTIQGGLGPQISNLSASNEFGKYPKSSKVLPFSFPEKLKSFQMSFGQDQSFQNCPVAGILDYFSERTKKWQQLFSSRILAN